MAMIAVFVSRMRQISGVGDTKLRNYGDSFLGLIAQYSQAHGLAQDVAPPARSTSLFQDPGANKPAPGLKLTLSHHQAFQLFRDGAVIEDVMHQMNRSRKTIFDYLGAYIRSEKPKSIRPWVKDEVYNKIAAAARLVGTGQLKPIFLALGETIDYDQIRLVVTHLAAQS